MLRKVKVQFRIHYVDGTYKEYTRWICTYQEIVNFYILCEYSINVGACGHSVVDDDKDEYNVVPIV